MLLLPQKSDSEAYEFSVAGRRRKRLACDEAVTLCRLSLPPVPFGGPMKPLVFCGGSAIKACQSTES